MQKQEEKKYITAKKSAKTMQNPQFSRALIHKDKRDVEFRNGTSAIGWLFKQLEMQNGCLFGIAGRIMNVACYLCTRLMADHKLTEHFRSAIFPGATSNRLVSSAIASSS